jgi:plasmid maintenance system antidote protein VapI
VSESRPFPPSEIRAEIGRTRIKLYTLAALVGLHPTHLGRVLNERTPLTPALAARIQAALKTWGAPKT